jgi:hypothetical protein
MLLKRLSTNPEERQKKERKNEIDGRIFDVYK